MCPVPVSLLRSHASWVMGPLTLPILNGWFRRFWLSWDMIHVSTGEGDIESLLPAQNEYGVRTGERLSLLPAHHLETVDGDALLPWKDGLAVEMNPRSVRNAKGSGILPKNVLLMGTVI